MTRTIVLVVFLAFIPAVALGQIQVTGAMIGNGPYYLDQAGATYTLTEDISTPGTAFVFSAPDVTLDLGGHTVTFGQGPEKYRYGVVVPTPYPHSAPSWSQSDITRWAVATGATVSNGRIVQGAGRADSCFAVESREQDRITLHDLDITIYGGDTFAIRVENCRTLYVYGNRITDRTQVVTDRHMGRAAIDVVDSRDGAIEIFNNEIHDCRQWGIRVSRGNYPTTVTGRVYNNRIYPNTITTNGYGIGVHAPNYEIYGNVIHATNGRGIHLEGCSDVRVHDNDVDVKEEPFWEEYTRVSGHGIKLEGCRDTEVYSNTVLSRGIVNSTDAVGNGAALSISVGSASNNYVHDNLFIGRHMGGTAFDPSNYGWYATPVEIIEVKNGLGLRLENNIFESNDRFFVLNGWLPDSTGVVSGSSLIMRGNRFRRDTEGVPTGREEVLVANSSVEGIRFTNSVFEDGVDLRRYKAGWPWRYCSWGVNWSGIVRVVDPNGNAVPGIGVEARAQDGAVAAAAVTDAAGNAEMTLDEYAVSTVGFANEHMADTSYANPYEIRASLATGTVVQTAAIHDPYFQVTISTDGSGPGEMEAPAVTDLGPAFQPMATSPLPGAVQVPPEAEVRCRFSEPIDESRFSADQIRVRGTVSGTCSGSVFFGMGGTLLLFRPNAPFVANETVTVTISGGLQDTRGERLDGNRDGIATGNELDSYEFQFVVAGS